MNILPSGWSDSGSLADVLASSILAMSGAANPLKLSGVKSAIVLVVDGLGYQNLTEYRGHARFLHRDVHQKLHTVFPTTTASALTTLTTGLLPGEHGMVGYQARDPKSGLVLNQLSGWGDEMVPTKWQPHPTLFEQRQKHRNLVFSDPKHKTSGLTQAILRGTEYVGVKDLSARFEAASDAVRSSNTLIYLYTADLDSAAHSHGVGSSKWLDALEEIDSLYGTLSKSMPKTAGLLVTGDHGVLNVLEEDQVVFPRDADFLSQVDAIAGEPRCLQLHVSAHSDISTVQKEIQSEVGDRGIVYTKSQLADSGIFGQLHDVASSRMGDLFLLAQKNHAFYTDDALTGTKMIGQHGGLDQAEVFIPLILSGAWAK